MLEKNQRKPLQTKNKTVKTLFRLTKDKVDLSWKVTKVFLKERTKITIKKLDQLRLLGPNKN